MEFFSISGLPFLGKVDFIGGTNRLLKKYGKYRKLMRADLFEAFLYLK